MKKKFLLSTFFSLMANLLFAINEPIYVKEGFRIIHLSGGFNFTKTQNPLTINQLDFLLKHNSFLTTSKFETIRDKNYYCINIALKNIDTKTQKIILRIDDPKIDSLQLIIFDGLIFKDYGISSNFAPSNIHFGKNLRREYQLDLKPDQQYSLFFNINNKTSLLRLRLPITLIENNYYDSYIFKIGFFEKFYLGTLFFVILFVASLYIIFFETIFLNYLIYLVGLAFFYFFIENYIVYFSSADNIFRNTQLLLAISYILMSWGYGIYSEKFLNANEYSPKLIIKFWKYLQTSILVFSISHILGILTNAETLASIQVGLFLIIPLMLLTNWIFCFYSIKNNYKPALLYAIGYLPLFLNFVFIDVFNEVGFLGDNIVQIFYSTQIFELFILTIGLIYRFKIIQIERGKLKSLVAEQMQQIFKTELQAQETERNRIAEDLHDEVGNSLAELKNYVSQTNLELSNKINKIAQDVRNISHNLASIDFEKTSFSEAFQNLINRHNDSENIDYELIEIGSPIKFSTEKSLTVYRICCELLNNIQKHSKANTATVQLVYEPSSLTIIVEDDGIGIKNKNNEGEGIGLKNIQTRVIYLNGKLTIDDDGKGTIIVIDVPI